jgi:hypothetical protein
MKIFYLPEQAMAWATAMLEMRSLTVMRRLCLLYCCSHSLLTTTRFPTSPTWSEGRYYHTVPVLCTVLLQPLPPHHHQVPHQSHLVSKEILPYSSCTVYCTVPCLCGIKRYIYTYNENGAEETADDVIVKK